MMALGSVQFSLATTVGGTGVVPAISAGASNQQRPPRLASADSACCTADQPPPHCRLSRSCSRPRGHLLTAGGNSNCGRSPRGGSTVAHCWQPAAAVGPTFVAVAAVGVAAVPSDYPECCKSKFFKKGEKTWHGKICNEIRPLLVDTWPDSSRIIFTQYGRCLPLPLPPAVTCPLLLWSFF